MNLTFEDVEALLRVFSATEYSEIRIELGEFKFAASKNGRSLPQVTTSVSPDASVEEALPTQPQKRVTTHTIVEAGTIAVRTEVAGQFYRSPSPGAEPFCKLGDHVSADTIVCLVEVMKLFTSLKAGVSGTVARILVENGSAVEPGEPLILIRPGIS